MPDEGVDPGGLVDPAPVDAEESAAKGRRLQERVTAGLIFSLIAMVTGCLSLYVAWRTSSEEAAIVLNAYPTASADDLTHAGFGVRVQLVNESLRPVIVENASLRVDGHEVSNSTDIWPTLSSSINRRLPRRRSPTVDLTSR